jgi:hypothetical protein
MGTAALSRQDSMAEYIKNAAMTLSEVALGRPLSVTNYSDSSLTSILNAESASRIISEILGDDQILGEVARRSYTHSNGFDKITLVSSREPEFKLRLHIWWPRRRDCQSREFVHNHRWLFRSTVLCGSAYVETFTEKDGGELMYRHEYLPRDDTLEKYELRAVGRSRVASDLMFMLAPGSTYSMGPDLLHRVLWIGDTLSVTMLVRWNSTRPTAMVFSPSEIRDERILSVPSFSRVQLRTKLERIAVELAAWRPLGSLSYLPYARSGVLNRNGASGGSGVDTALIRSHIT